jgi:hypothetical protein
VLTLGRAVVLTLVRVVALTLVRVVVRILAQAAVRTLVRVVVHTPDLAVEPTLVQVVALTLGREGLVTPAPGDVLTISGTGRLPTADSCNSFRSPDTISHATPALTSAPALAPNRTPSCR